MNIKSVGLMLAIIFLVAMAVPVGTIGAQEGTCTLTVTTNAPVKVTWEEDDVAKSASIQSTSGTTPATVDIPCGVQVNLGFSEDCGEYV